MVSTPANWRAGPGDPGILEVIKLLEKSQLPTMVSTPTNWRAGLGDPGILEVIKLTWQKVTHPQWF
jgi:hypothetical protein